MALTTSKAVSQDIQGGARLAVYDVTFDSSYPTGGETFDISADFSSMFFVKVAVPGAYKIEHDDGTAAAGVLVASDLGAGTQVANTTDLSAVTCRVFVYGLSS